MSLIETTQKLRWQFEQLVNRPDWALLVRYELLPQHREWSYRIGRWLRVVGLSRSYYFRQRWSASLKHTNNVATATATATATLLIWAEGVELQQIREYCHGFKQHLAQHKNFIPVLVTDVADFAFYSRLGWLVEYLPEISNGINKEDLSASYREKKRQYLAWRYRDALVVPVAAGIANPQEWQMILQVGFK